MRDSRVQYDCAQRDLRLSRNACYIHACLVHASKIRGPMCTCSQYLHRYIVDNISVRKNGKGKETKHLEKYTLRISATFAINAFMCVRRLSEKSYVRNLYEIFDKRLFVIDVFFFGDDTLYNVESVHVKS